MPSGWIMNSSRSIAILLSSVMLSRYRGCCERINRAQGRTFLRFPNGRYAELLRYYANFREKYFSAMRLSTPATGLPSTRSVSRSHFQRSMAIGVSSHELHSWMLRDSPFQHHGGRSWPRWRRINRSDEASSWFDAKNVASRNCRLTFRVRSLIC